MESPKTWNELKDAGYVTELTEKQVAEAKARLKNARRESDLEKVDRALSEFRKFVMDAMYEGHHQIMQPDDFKDTTAFLVDCMEVFSDMEVFEESES